MRSALGLLVLIVCGLAACNDSSGLKGIEDFELAERHGNCLKSPPTAPGKATACENIRRECDRRREELGRYICQ